MPANVSLFPTADRATRMAAYSILPPYTIRRTVPEVRLQFTVADEQGRQVASLTKNDLRILDNQLTVRRIREFSRMQDLPLQLGLLLDVSDSVQRIVPYEKQAVQSFLQHVLRPQTDRAFLMAFGHEVNLWLNSTGERSELNQAVQGIHQLGTATNLYDGLYAACRSEFPQSVAPDPAQRVLVVFSDGEDTGSLHGMPDVIAEAQRKEIQIYAVSIHPTRRFLRGDQVLQQLADETGGRFYLAGAPKDLPAIFAAMEGQMRTQYYVSFQPTQETPGFHTLRLEVTGPQKLHVRARQGYYFEAP
jgi:Ca-activated chloride channel homolog